MTYSSTYKGAGRNGYVYTSTPMRNSVSTGLAQVPTASMSSTGAYSTYGSTMSSRVSTGGYLASSKQNVGGIRTSAEYIRGGVTTYTPGYGTSTHGRKRADQYNPPGSGDTGYNPWCHYEWVADPDDEVDGGYWRCTECGAELGEASSCDEEHHFVPITDGWQVWLFMIALAGAYVAWKTRSKKINEA